MVTKSVLSSQTTIIGYTELKAKLTAYEVELRLERDIEPGQALYSKSMKTGRFKKPSNYSRKGVAPGPRSKPIKGKFARSCHHCGKPGHKIRECRAKANEDTGLGISVKRSMNQTGRAGVMEEQLWLASDANAESVHEVKRVEKAMMGKHVVPDMDWVIDSGCTNHMTKHAGVFLERTYKRLTCDERQMCTATGELVSAAGIGTVRIRIWSLSQGLQTILLQEVLHTPSAGSTNLNSVSQLTVKGINISFKRDIAEVFRDGILMAIAKKVDRLYTILTDPSVTDEGLLISLKDPTLTTLWHYRLGHLHHQALLKMSSKKLVSGLPALQENSITGRCDACLKGKMIRTPLKPAAQRTSTPLELIHLDLNGPMQQVSFGGCQYFMLLIDDFTKFTAVYFLKKKSDTAESFKAYKTHVERQHQGSGKDYIIKAVRTDAGGEYTGEAFQRELRRCGIEFQSTVPYTPQEDSVSENSNRVLVGRANVLLQQASAPMIYWADTVQTAVYLKNLSITKGTHGIDAMPYELWFGKKPNIQHLRVWGCIAYAHIHPAKRADKKWSPRAERLIFIGYTLLTKQYRLKI